MIRQTAQRPASKASDLDMLPELICRFVEERGPQEIERLCLFLDTLASLLHSYQQVVHYAGQITPDADDLSASRKAVRLALANILDGVRKRQP
jgi:hypothetical protein